MKEVQNPIRRQIPGCLGCFCETWCLSSAIQLIQELIRDLRVASTDHWEAINPTGPISGVPHGHSTAHLELPLCIGPDPLEGFVTNTATNFHHGAAQTLQERKGRPLSDGNMLWPQHNGEATTKRIERQPQTGSAAKGSGVLLKLVASGQQRNRGDPMGYPKS